MAQRPEDSRYPRPIVPDPDASLSDHRLRRPPPPRLWPLWLMIIVLLLALVSLGAVGWLHTQHLQQRLDRLGGEISNFHARLDAEQGRGEALDRLRTRLSALESLEKTLTEQREARLATWREEHLSELEERYQALEKRLPRLVEAAERRDATLTAVRTSLDALERAGEEGRAALWEELATLQEARENDATRRETLAKQLERLESRLDERVTRVESRLTDVVETLGSMGDDVEGLAGSGQDARDDIDRLNKRLGDLQAEMRTLRQSQLALSAQVEVLRQ